MTLPLRAALLTACLSPYIYYGVRDVLHHRKHRSLPFGERLLHLTLGLTLAILIPHAYRGRFDVAVPGVVLFALARALDEFIFHRGLAAEESDLHAKTHFGFLIFVIGIIGANWLDHSGGP